MLSDPAALIRSARERAGLSQAALAARAGTSQPAIARLEAGAASPTVATLARILEAAGFRLRTGLAPLPSTDPVIECYKRDVDRSLLRENLRRSIDERLAGLAAMEALGDALQRALRPAPRNGATSHPRSKPRTGRRSAKR